MELNPADELKAAHNILDNNHSVASERYTMMELVLFREWLKKEVKGTAYISHHDLCEILKCDKRTLRRLNYDLTESGRWDIVPGTAKLSTSYIPSFLNTMLEGGETYNDEN